MMLGAKNILVAAQAIQADIAKEIGPPEEGLLASSQQVVMASLVRNTRHIGDFSDWRSTRGYESGFGRLVRDLRPKTR